MGIKPEEKNDKQFYEGHSAIKRPLFIVMCQKITVVKWPQKLIFVDGSPGSGISKILRKTGFACTY